MDNDYLLSQATGGFVNTDIDEKMKEELGSKELPEDYVKLMRDVAAEGIVMLKNDGVLPLSSETVSIFGRVQYDYFYVGNGSGGDVITPYQVNLLEGFDNTSKLNYNKELAEIYTTWCKNNKPDPGSWGTWPTNYEEMPLTDEIIKNARSKSNTAVLIIGRSAGEDRDSTLTEGSFYLTKIEEKMIEDVSSVFEKVVLLINSGNIIDFSWYEKYENKINALLYVWQGGIESGNAVCDTLSGDKNPSGKLTTAIARNYSDYPSSENFGGEEFNNYVEDIYVGYRYFETFAPEAVLFPFGFGLSYTTFDISVVNEVELDEDNEIHLKVSVTNTGVVAGAEVIQVYHNPPQGVLGKPARALIAFTKTNEIKPGSTEIVKCATHTDYMMSYDDSGKTGFKSAYVFEAGKYEIYVGNSVRSAKKIGSIEVDELILRYQMTEVAAVEEKNKFKRLVAKANADGSFLKEYEDTPTRTVSLKEQILAQIPEEFTKPTEPGEYSLNDIKEGKITIEEFVATLDINELEALTRGDYIMNSPLGAPGNAGVFGGITESLRKKGVIPITTSDGPSGVRLRRYAAQLPCGLAIASTWNGRLVEKLATEQGKELDEKGSHVLLAPGMNILRNPLCGRNFEYYSEDPFLSGRIAMFMVEGLQSHGKSACPKHFVCNNQEQFRSINDSRVSERALREIYLKGFEYCIKYTEPNHVMTSYNKINGVWGHYHFELCNTVLRDEWGYEGTVLTDWWMKPCVDPDFPNLSNDAYRIRAQVDVLMPGGFAHFETHGDGSLLESYNKEDGVTLGEIQRSAANVLRFVMYVLYDKPHTWKRRS